jgi:hypothetical protein
LNNFKFLVVDEATSEGNQSDGLIGVGPKQLVADIAGGKAPTFIQVAAKQNLIANVFSLLLTGNT